MEAEQLKAHLGTITTLSAGFITTLESKIQREYYSAHQIVHPAGQTENRIYFLEKGLARNYYYNHYGQERTAKFWTTGDIMFSYEGYFSVPSYFYTEILERSTVTTLSYKLLHEMTANYKEIPELTRHTLLEYQQEEYRRRELLELTAEERYRALRAAKPMLFQRVPTKIIGSYLNMTRETLTRLIGRK